MILTLVPTRQFDLALQGGGNTITVTQGSDALVMDMAAVLRGVQGPAGYGLLGSQPVTDAATVSVDISATVGVFVLSLGGNRTLHFTGGTAELDRKRFILEVTQDATGGRTLAGDSTVGFGSDIPAIDLSAGPGVTDALGFIYRHADGKCHLLALNHGA